MIQDSDVGSSFPYKGTYLLYDEGESWTDYTFDVDVMTNEKFDLDNEDIGVLFRYQDENNYYQLIWEQNGKRDKMYLRKLVQGVPTVLGEKKVNLEKNTWYSLKIVLNGNNIKVYSNTYFKQFDIDDNSFTSGTIALFCWKNEMVLFDDVLITNNNGDILLEEGFDYGNHNYDWTIVNEASGESQWHNTTRQTDQEDFYQGPDFVYRILSLASHYNKNNIYYLNADRWRDADGDGTNDVNTPSTKANLQYAIDDWFESKNPDGNDHNLVYLFDHGWYAPILHSYITIDSNRNGLMDKLPLNEKITSKNIDDWLPYYGVGGIGRLTFMVEACFIGEFIDRLSHDDENRIIIVTSTKDVVAEPETGQDWSAFSYRLFKEMADGETTIAEAFSIADKHVDLYNFFSKWLPKYYTNWDSQDAKLDDNGDGVGSDYDLPGNGNWFDLYQGSFADRQWVTKLLDDEYFVTKARVRFHVRCGLLERVTADLYEFDFHGADWVSPTGDNDPEQEWNDESYAFDDILSTKAGCTTTQSTWHWTPYLELSLSQPLYTDKIRFYAWYSGLYCNKIDVDVYYGDGYLAAKTGL